MITFISNWVLKRVCMLLTKREKNVTKTAYEIGCRVRVVYLVGQGLGLGLGIGLEKNMTKTAYEIGNPNPNLNLNPNPDPNPNSNQPST